MKKKKILICGLASALIGVSCLSAGIAWQYAKADGFSDVQIEETYSYASEFSVPETVYTVDGSSVDASHTMTLPDGTTSNSSVIELMQVGVYNLSYTVKSGGETKEKTYSFRVDYPIAFTESVLSSVAYGEYNGVQGLNCAIRCGESLTFSQPIDISWLGKADTLFEFFLLPTEAGKSDFTSMEIVLTDFYDENNYVRILNTPYLNYPTWHSYSKACATGQVMSGLDLTGGYVHINNIYGMAIKDFIWEPSGNYENNRLTYAIDLKEQQVYNNKMMVIDLNNPSYFSTLWEGFSSNLVTLTIKPTQGTIANFFITDVYGTDLSKSEIVDTLSPTVTVDTQSYGNELPDAIVGKQYKLFDATAVDFPEGVVSVTKKVYRNYYSSAKISVALKDGAFTPDKVGTYYLEYSAKDSFGNVETKVFTVSAKTAASVTPLSVVIEGGDRTALAGKEVTLGEVTAKGGTGNAEINVVVSDGKGTQQQVEGTSFSSWGMGTYTVSVTATDYVGNVAEETYTIDVKANPAPVFVSDVAIPEYMIAGSKYALPTLQAKDYGTTPVALITASVSVNGSGSLQNGTYIPSESDIGKELTITYTATGASGSNTTTHTVTIISNKTNNAFDVSKYFVYENATGTLTKDDLSVAVKDGSKITFVNPVLWQSFELQFKPDSQDGSVVIELTGFENKDEVLQFAYVKSGGKTSVNVNDSLNYTTSYSAGKASISLSYDYTKGSYYTDSRAINVPTFMNGEPFKGFTGNYVTMRIYVTDTAESGTLRISSLSRQKFSFVDGDFVDPMGIILGEYGGRYAVGYRATTAEFAWGDVLSCYTEITVSVYKPDNTYVTSVDGVVLEEVPYKRYTFDCNEYGSYSICFTVIDETGNDFDIVYVINIGNAVAPTIKLTSDVPKTVTAGKSFKIPTAEVYDDLTGADEVVLAVFLHCPDGTCVMADGQMTLERKGKYTLTYMAMDTTGNLTFLDVEFTVA